MKARRFDEVLRARGYKIKEHAEYAGNNIYIKKHLYCIATCTVAKDSHGKAQAMMFIITSQVSNDPEIAKKIENDEAYLRLEATKIHDAFEQLKQLKSPKYIYCF